MVLPMRARDLDHEMSPGRCVSEAQADSRGTQHKSIRILGDATELALHSVSLDLLSAWTDPPVQPTRIPSPSCQQNLSLVLGRECSHRADRWFMQVRRPN